MMTTEAIEQGPEEMVSISKSEYDELVNDRRFLEALQGAGVDNWDGYSYAQEIFDGEEE